jgi:hypothetical protein
MNKTIPYRLSPAELENFRILRRKIKTFESYEEKEEEDLVQKSRDKTSDTVPIRKKTP